MNTTHERVRVPELASRPCAGAVTLLEQIARLCRSRPLREDQRGCRHEPARPPPRRCRRGVECVQLPTSRSRPPGVCRRLRQSNPSHYQQRLHPVLDARPQGLRSQLIARVGFRGVSIALAYLCRRGRGGFAEPSTQQLETPTLCRWGCSPRWRLRWMRIPLRCRRRCQGPASKFIPLTIRLLYRTLFLYSGGPKCASHARRRRHCRSRSKTCCSGRCSCSTSCGH